MLPTGTEALNYRRPLKVVISSIAQSIIYNQAIMIPSTVSSGSETIQLVCNVPIHGRHQLAESGDEKQYKQYTRITRLNEMPNTNNIPQCSYYTIGYKRRTSAASTGAVGETTGGPGSWAILEGLIIFTSESN